MNKNWPKWVGATAILAALGVTVALLARAGNDRGASSQSANTDGGQNDSHKQFWHCGMHPWVVSEKPGDCPVCHMKLTPMNAGPSGNLPAESRKVLYFWDPMLGPSSISDKPGKSAMGMDLVPVYAESGGPSVTIDPTVVQNMGVRTALVTKGPLTKTVRVLGIVKIAESGLFDVSVKVGGWIDKLYADEEGQDVVKGQPLFELYSQDLQVAQEELISATKSEQSLTADAAQEVRQQAHTLVESAKRKLRLWDVAEQDIAAIAEAATPLKDIPFRSPVAGHLVEKTVVEGTAVQPGMKLMRIEDHTKMWLDLQVYEDQLPMVKLGQMVVASVDGIPGKTFKGTIGFIYPHFDHATRTITARVTLNNPAFRLKPGMYATAEIVTEPIEDAIQVPREAVIDTGTRQIVFVDEGQGHFEPRKVFMGIVGDDDRVQIVNGLSPGEMVVTSGQFLLDVESRTTEAINKLRRSRAPTSEPATTAAMTEEPSEARVPETRSIVDTSAAIMPDHEHQMDAAQGATERPVGPGAAATQPIPGKLSLVQCTMATADWIQIGDTVANPYLGSSMPGCGDIIRKVNAPLAGSPLAEYLDAYLGVGKDLSADKFGSATIKRLVSAAGQLPELTFGSLKNSTTQFASAGNIAAARERFKKLSLDLISVLEHPAR